MTVAQAHSPETLGSLWNVSAATVRNLCKAGDLPSFRIGRQFRIHQHEVDTYEARQRAADLSLAKRPAVGTRGPSDVPHRSGAAIIGKPAYA